MVLTPLPRFVSGKCCEKPNHLTNFGPEDCAKTLLELADWAKDRIKGILSGLNLKGIKTTNAAKSLLGVDGTETRHWGEDPIHPRPSGYAAIFSRIIRDYNLTLTAQKRKASASWEAPSYKRPQPLPSLAGHPQW